VTNDNPRSEPPDEIARAVTEGLVVAGMATLAPADLSTARRGYFIELDRARAIAAAVLAAAPGDTIVVCGKGHEEYQVTGDVRVRFDDRAEARRALGARRQRVHDRTAGSV